MNSSRNTKPSAGAALDDHSGRLPQSSGSHAGQRLKIPIQWTTLRSRRLPLEHRRNQSFALARPSCAIRALSLLTAVVGLWLIGGADASGDSVTGTENWKKL